MCRTQQMIKACNASCLSVFGQVNVAASMCGNINFVPPPPLRALAVLVFGNRVTHKINWQIWVSYGQKKQKEFLPHPQLFE